MAGCRWARFGHKPAGSIAIDDAAEGSAARSVTIRIGGTIGKTESNRQNWSELQPLPAGFSLSEREHSPEGAKSRQLAGGDAARRHVAKGYRLACPLMVR